IPSHTAEFLYQHGFVDQVVERPRLRDTIATILRIVNSRPVAPREERTTAKPSVGSLSAWDVVQIARHPARPTALDYLRRISPQFVELHGDRVFGDDPAIVGGLGEIAGRGVVFIGHER